MLDQAWQNYINARARLLTPGQRWTYFAAEGQAAPAFCIRCGPIWVECDECSKALGGERAEGQA